MKEFFIRLSDWADRVTGWMCFVLMTVMVAVVGAEVIARYVFTAPIFWSEEFASMVFIWLVFLGASIGVKRGAHMGIHFIVDWAPDRMKRVLRIVSATVSTVFFLVVLVNGIAVTMNVASDLTPAMQISNAWEYAAVPVGAFFMLLHIPCTVLTGDTKTSDGTGDVSDLDPVI